MRSVCREYQRFSRAYKRAFIAWGEPKNVNGHGAIDDDLDALESKYRLLADHQQSCPACLAELGIVLPQARAYSVAQRSTT